MKVDKANVIKVLTMLLLHCNVVVVGLICIKCSILYVTMCHGMNEWTIQFAISMVLVLASALCTIWTLPHSGCVLVTVVTENKNMFWGDFLH